MAKIRPPAAAGTFYAASPSELEATVEALYAEAEGELSGTEGDEPPKAIMAPHAGYVYSGLIAAHAFRRLVVSPGEVRRIVLLGPAHRVSIRGLALPGAHAFETPLGLVEIDEQAAQGVAELPQVSTDPNAHSQEHALEVELPFLQVRFPRLRILPLVVGRCEAEEVAEVLDLLWGDESTSIVISSDLSHYLSYAEACQMDSVTSRTILRLGGPLTTDQACGAIPLNGLLLVARRREMQARLLDLRNSGDTAGSRDQVVGYGAFGFFAS